MYRLAVFSVVLTLALASPGNLGYGPGLGATLAGGAGYGGNGPAFSSFAAAPAAPVVAAAAVAPVVAAAPVAPVPVATSTRARVDHNGPTQVITQFSAVPVAPLVVGAFGGAGAGAGGLGAGSAVGGLGYGAAAGGLGYSAGGLGYGNAAGSLGYGNAAGRHGGRGY